MVVTSTAFRVIQATPISPILLILNKARVLQPEQKYPWSSDECEPVEMRDSILFLKRTPVTDNSGVSATSS